MSLPSRFAALLVFVAAAAGAQSGPGMAVRWISSLEGRFILSESSPTGDYAYPNGLWLAADYDGDGDIDFAHVVAESDFVQVWRTHSFQFDVTLFVPWSGYKVSTGLWRSGDFNGDGKSDLLHAVGDSNYVHVWMSNGDGTFDVNTFSPWPDYSIPNGLWMIGHFNDDAAADIFHAVDGRDYAHVWLSRSDGTFDVGAFRPWAGYAIPNGLWLTGDFDDDRHTDIFHAVQDSNYAHIWLSDGKGGFAVKTFSPAEDYVIPNGIWRTGDFDGDRRTDVVHGVQDTDYVHVWKSNGDGSFDVSVASGPAGYVIPNGEWIVGRFNGDGRDDLLHVVNNVDYVHTWLSRTDGKFDVTTMQFWGGYPASKGLVIAGPPDPVGRTNPLHVLSIAPARGLSVRRHTSAALTNDEANEIYNETTLVLWRRETMDDLSCDVRPFLSGTVGTFTAGDGFIDTEKEWDTVNGQSGFVKVVSAINWCGKITTALGCADVGSSSMVVVRLAAPMNEGILWAHEYGHTRGLGHRSGSTSLMHPTYALGHTAVNADECKAFKK